MKLSSVSFFCPAYNDEKNLPRLIPGVVDFLQKITDKFEIIIIEDGSPDGTGRVADELAKQYPNVRVVHHAKNMGYGAVLRDGFRAGRYDYVMYTDGDAQYDIAEFEPYLYLLETNDIISGYAISKAVSTARKIQSLVYNILIFLLFGVWYKDANCSMKIYSRKALDCIKIKSASAFIDCEMLIRARRAGFRIGQFPVHHLPRTAGLAHGSKFSMIAGTIKDMLLFRLGLL